MSIAGKESGMFDTLSDQARLWIYAFPETLDEDQIRLVRKHLNAFIGNWKSHGKAIRGEYELLYDQFILIATDDDPSGCSIDSSARMFRELKERHGLDALTSHLIFYRDEYRIRSVEREAFQQLVEEGVIGDHTVVFNTMLTSIGGLRNGEWELSFQSSWHRKAFRKSA
jgi:hypothetical protein